MRLHLDRRSLAGGATAGTGAASRVRFAPASNNLLVSSWDSGLRLYDTHSNTLRFKAESEAGLLDCCFENESAAFAGCSDGSLRRYDFRSGSEDTVGHHEDVVAFTEYCQITGQIVTATFNNEIQFWDAKARSESRNGTINFKADVTSLSFGGMYLSASVGRKVYFFDMRNPTRPVKAKISPLEYQIQCHQYSPEWDGYVAASVDGVCALNFLDDVKNENMGYAFRCHPSCRNGRSKLVPINCMAIHPSDKTFVTGDDEGYAIAWDVESKKKLELPIYPGSVASTAYNYNGQLLAVAANYYEDADKMVKKHEICIEKVEVVQRKRKPHLVIEKVDVLSKTRTA